MYTEIVKIIEGGLNGDKEKVQNFATVLADNLEKQDEIKLANRIRTILTSKKFNLASLDSFATKPIDGESRMEIVEVTIPQIDISNIILNKYTENEISSFIDCYKNRDNLLKAGVELANSLLLYGPPGCGKTTVAQYVSIVTGLPLVTARLDGLVSSLLGSTAKNIRKIFDYASKRECILFLDEFDVIAKLRDDKNELGELKRVVNSLIQNIDGLNNNSILIAATNHHELLDPAIWRRFSRVITLDKPQKDEINKLLDVYLMPTQNTILDNEKKLGQLSNALIGFSHSEIKTIIINAIRNSIITKKEVIGICDVLKEVYFHRYHNIDDENKFIRFLLQYSITHKEINENFGIALRKIQNISKNDLKE